MSKSSESKFITLNISADAKAEAVHSLVDDAGSNFFTVTFIKKDGTSRVMNCRKGVTKHLKGGKSTTAHIEDIVSVFDMKANGYRSFKASTVTEFKSKANHVKFA